MKPRVTHYCSLPALLQRWMKMMIESEAGKKNVRCCTRWSVIVRRTSRTTQMPNPSENRELMRLLFAPPTLFPWRPLLTLHSWHSSTALALSNSVAAGEDPACCGAAEGSVAAVGSAASADKLAADAAAAIAASPTKPRQDLILQPSSLYYGLMRQVELVV